ncbi:N-acetyl-gamma-glutamyl-phosphate reductase [Mechercharimyces sp. CAU 1602]|uniref:N-acetyl-gamma-glutamyl-phosphate reductase n=1 Tax=Mechercharimyces sp. CAU 1602 TaxID=2973933 RepID=UPI0021619BC5|nr:N-acetyl-gamma-glutamyl-phosphate reductase [Mechercharimyces sp. CAU 1602]MCS1350070.1 N-acetyl-gamma-glutamyl-phosphate reductase [Mechercharimyces sp. CAU 1602]
MKAVVIGATGYGGVELVRLLDGHPHLEIGGLFSFSQAGKSYASLYPHLSHLEWTLAEMDVEAIIEAGEVVFFATPAGVSREWAPLLAERGKICIDLSGDFRLNSEDYRKWYGKKAATKRWLDESVYGLSEWFPEKIKEATLIANPGCYPTATLLALLPLLRAELIDPDFLVIDGKSGVTGAGRSTQQSKLFCETSENLRAYKVEGHQHIPEIERFASKIARKPINVSFTPHLVPMNRGLLVTMVAKLQPDVHIDSVRMAYEEDYKNQPFLRLLPEGCWPQTKGVQASNYCDISYSMDERTGRLTVVSVIDNLVKGAAGQAIQNANLRFDWPETSGLTGLPMFP